MITNRLAHSLVALSAVVLFALPTASAFASPIVEPNRGTAESASRVNTVSRAPAASRAPAPSRAAYYAVKEQQAELASETAGRYGRRPYATRKVFAARAALTSYASLKEQQMQRLIYGD